MQFTKEISEQIKNYLAQTLKPLICVVGPTGSGKTGFALEVAKEFDGELINADSRQIFKCIEFLTGLNYEEIKDFKNYLFGTCEIVDTSWTSAKFLQEVRKIIEEIYSRNKVPVLVGGTGLFVSSLIEGFEMPENSVNKKLREEFSKKTKEELFEELKVVDSKSAEKLHKNNRNYVERALEVFYSGEKKSEGKKNPDLAFDSLIFHKKIETSLERENLYEKINSRQRMFFEEGIMQFDTFKDFLGKELPALNTIGIAEIESFKKGVNSKEEALKKMQQRARNYAKRQLTWWRNKKGVNLVL